MSPAQDTSRPASGPHQYSRIVVGTDGSPLATTVVQRAARIAISEDADLVMVSAWTGLSARDEAEGSGALGMGAIVGRLPSRAAAARALAEAANLATASGATVAQTLLVDGDAAAALIEAVTTVGAELVVMGAFSRPGLTERLLGDVASEVVRKATCDVLIVRPEAS